MKQKYQEDFTPGIYTPGRYKQIYNNMTVFSDKFPKDEIDVYESKKGSFEDTYPHIYFRESVEALMNELAKPLFKQCICYSNVCTIPTDESVSIHSSLMDYLKNTCLNLSASIYIKESNDINNYNELSSKLETEFKEHMLPRDITLYYLHPQVKLSQITRSINQQITNGENHKKYIRSLSSIIII